MLWLLNRKAAILVYLVLALQNGVFKYLQTWLKSRLTVSTDITFL